VGTITVRRWVAAPPEDVWPHVLDLEQVVLDDHALDLEDLIGDHATGQVPGAGARATITRRSGARIERIALHVGERVVPSHVAATLRLGGERWLLTIDVQPLVGDDGCGSDVRFHAEPDPSFPRPRLPSPRRASGNAHTVGALLEALAAQLDGLAERHRIAAGR
jgi:hypothetical protein